MLWYQLLNNQEMFYNQSFKEINNFSFIFLKPSLYRCPMSYTNVQNFFEMNSTKF